jgi:hypothetical protein
MTKYLVQASWLSTSWADGLITVSLGLIAFRTGYVLRRQMLALRLLLFPHPKLLSAPPHR